MLVTTTGPAPSEQQIPDDEPISKRAQIPHPSNKEEKAVTEELRRRMQEWEAYDHEFLSNVDYEQAFRSGSVWIDRATGVDKGQMLRDLKRSAHHVDLLNPSIESEVNKIRLNKIAATFIPIGEGADKATAEIRQGLYRNINRVSKAEIARETMHDMAVAYGRGYERICIEDEPGPTFDKRIAIRRIENLKSVAIDHTGTAFDYEDAEWCFFFDDVSPDILRALHGRAFQQKWGQPAAINGMELADNERLKWFPNNKVRVGEYYRKKYYLRTVWQLADGSCCWKDEAPTGAVPVREMDKLDWVVEYRKMTALQTLERRIWPGRRLPIVVEIGKEEFRGKKPKIHSGMVKPAVELIQTNNYLFSRMIDEVGLSPLPHMLAPENSFSPAQEAVVNTINAHPWAVVTYKPQQDGNGRQVAPPRWESPSPNIGAVVSAAEIAKDNLQRVLNVFSPQLGAPQGDQSGKAIREVKIQGDLVHASYSDNHRRAIQTEADIVNELMDFVYSEAQAITITHIDERTERVLINQKFQDERTGKVKEYLFGAGKYSAMVSPSQDYNTRQEESAERLLSLGEQFPQQIGQALDLLIEDLNIPRADKYAARFRPPGFDGGDEDGPSVAQLQQELAQSQQLLQQADDLINQLGQKIGELGSQEALKRLEIASRERIAARHDMAGLVKQENQNSAQAHFALFKAQIDQAMAALNAPTLQIDAPLEAGSTPAPAQPQPNSMPGMQPAPPSQEPPVNQ